MMKKKMLVGQLVSTDDSVNGAELRDEMLTYRDYSPNDGVQAAPDAVFRQMAPSSRFFFQAEDGIRYYTVTGVQTCALPIFGGRGIGGQAPGAADVSLRRTSRGHQAGRLDAVPVGQNLSDRVRRRHDQRDHPAARPDRGDEVLGRGRAEQPHGSRGGFLDRLEQGVGGLLRAPVGVLEQD